MSVNINAEAMEQEILKLSEPAQAVVAYVLQTYYDAHQSEEMVDFTDIFRTIAQVATGVELTLQGINKGYKPEAIHQGLEELSAFLGKFFTTGELIHHESH